MPTSTNDDTRMLGLSMAEPPRRRCPRKYSLLYSLLTSCVLVDVCGLEIVRQNSECVTRKKKITRKNRGARNYQLSKSRGGGESWV